MKGMIVNEVVESSGQQPAEAPYVLGLDIGVASIGWALVEIGPDQSLQTLRRTGVHLFEAGIDAGKATPEDALAQGKEQSKATPRRDARALRRQTWRRARRKKKVLSTLIRIGLLPSGDIRTPQAIDSYLKTLDADLRKRLKSANDGHTDSQNLIYRLRAIAAEKIAKADELGRALYHLAQRRGFLSNRKTPPRGDEDESVMKQAIGELAQHIAKHQPPTLGAYLASLDPDQERLRGRWTSRQMYLDEFEQIWRVQAADHNLSEEDKADLHAAIFFQRPLKDQSHLIGRCSHTGEKRLALADRLAQRFRVLQQVNHLRLVFDDLAERALTAEEREQLIAALITEGDLTMSKARKIIGLPRSVTFSIERGGEKRLVGHRTDAKLCAVFGNQRWDALTEDKKDCAVHDVRSVRDVDVLRRIGRQRWGLDADAADKFAALTLEEGHSAHSRKALQQLMPHMEQGLSYSEARQATFPDSFGSADPLGELPPLHEWDQDLRNPSVARALTELRKLVNAIIRRWGKPERIQIELARDLKAGRSRREQIARRMRDRQRERERAAKRISDELGEPHPRRWMIEKYLLAEECGWVCPYTGRCFNLHELLGPDAQYDIEHIWPFSQSLDNSFLNKTICYLEENRGRKRKGSPATAYTSEELEQIVARVKTFKTHPFTRCKKLIRFTEEMPSGFANRHLTETREIDRRACDYLGLLYGGRVEAQGTAESKQRIVTPSGGLVAWLRRGWQLDAVLSDRDDKNRQDHRHHAIDAIVIACSNQATIKLLADSAERMERHARKRPFETVSAPWSDFVEDVRRSINAVIVSHRQERKVKGALHKESLYSKSHNGTHRIRKELANLSESEVKSDQIIDVRAREAIRARLAELSEKDPGKAFRTPEQLPLVRGADGKLVRLRKVRVRVKDKPRAFGSGVRQRFANTAANHHTRILAVYDKHGRMKSWKDEPVVLADLVELVTQQRTAAPRDDVVFTLAANEYVEMDRPDGDGRAIYRVRNLSANQNECTEHWDGRSTKEIIRQEGTRGVRFRGSSLFKRNARKIHVTYLGEVRHAGG